MQASSSETKVSVGSNCASRPKVAGRSATFFVSLAAWTEALKPAAHRSERSLSRPISTRPVCREVIPGAWSTRSIGKYSGSRNKEDEPVCLPMVCPREIVPVQEVWIPWRATLASAPADHWNTAACVGLKRPSSTPPQRAMSFSGGKSFFMRS